MKSSSRRGKLFILAGAVVLLAAFFLFRWRVEAAYARRSLCVSRLNHISIAKRTCEDVLKLKQGDPVPDSCLAKELAALGGDYKCPSGGTYDVGPIGTHPRCSYTNICYTYSLEVFKIKRRAWVHSMQGIQPK